MGGVAVAVIAALAWYFVSRRRPQRNNSQEMAHESQLPDHPSSGGKGINSEYATRSPTREIDVTEFNSGNVRWNY